MLICLYYYVILFYSDCTFTSIYNIISLREVAWAHKTCLTPPLYLPVTSPENERPCMCVLVVSLLPLSTIFLLDFGTVPTLWYFLFFYWTLELFRQCGIFSFSVRFWNCSDSVVFFVFVFHLIFVTFGDTMLFVFSNSDYLFKAALINY